MIPILTYLSNPIMLRCQRQADSPTVLPFQAFGCIKLIAAGNNALWHSST